MIRKGAFANRPWTARDVEWFKALAIESVGSMQSAFA